MTITVTTVSNNQSFGAWLSTTNRLANLMTSNVVTADGTATGSLTTGNVSVNGHLGATFIYAGSGIVGGNLAANGQLNLLSNVLFKDISSANQVLILSNSTVSSVTLQTNTVSINPTANVTISAPLLTITSNVTVNTGTVSVRTLRFSGVSESTTFSNSFASVSTVTLDTFDKTVYRSAEYVIQSSYATGGVYEITRLHVVHDGSTAYSTEFGSISSNGTSLATLSTSVATTNVNVTITPTVAPLTVKVTRLINTV